MSDTDDTDVLVLLPPDLFIVDSSDTDDTTINSNKNSKSGVVSELINHVHSLENRIEAIEFKDNKKTPTREKETIFTSYQSQTLPRTKHSVSSKSFSEKHFTKFHQSSSLPSTPNHKKKSLRNSSKIHFNTMLNGTNQSSSTNSRKKLDYLSFAEPTASKNSLKNKNGLMHSPRANYSTLNNFEDYGYTKSYYSSTPLHGLMDTTDKSKFESLKDQKYRYYSGHNQVSDNESKRGYSDYSLPNDVSFACSDTDKFLVDFKPWTPSNQYEAFENKNVCKEYDSISQNLKSNETNVTDYMADKKFKDILYNSDSNIKCSDDLLKSQPMLFKKPEEYDGSKESVLSSRKSCPSILKYQNESAIEKSVDAIIKNSEFSKLASQTKSTINEKNIDNYAEEDNELCFQRSKNLLTLSDLWENDSNKSKEQILRLKLEEEKFRREHCEQLIQDLQKKLLEYQEQIAVAIRVDNEKNCAISQFKEAWLKLKGRLHSLESDNKNLQKNLQDTDEKHDLEILAIQEEVKKYKSESSKALDLATGYKEKSDDLIKEKLEILKNHADELENYKSLTKEAENRYENMKIECQKLLEKNKATEDSLKLVQQDLNKERLKGSEIRNEMAAIHKALDACEAELTILRQEKEGLQLKLKEEMNRVIILTEEKSSLITTLDEVRKLEAQTKNEKKSLLDQQESIKSELRNIYQKQVDEVVKTKLKEFQTQLDSAETTFHNEIETKQRAIAECAARKIKAFIDKHQLEVNLLEEKQKEEKRLYEIKLAQAVQKFSLLEAQLDSYQKNKNQLVEQLHSVMQKQWQQALKIISDGNADLFSPFLKINAKKILQDSCDALNKSADKHNASFTEPMKLESQKSLTNLHSIHNIESQNDSLITLTSHEETPLSSKKESSNELKNYIKMILDMQQTTNQKTRFLNTRLSNDSSCLDKDNQKTNKDINTSNDVSSLWQPNSETSMYDTSEYMGIQKSCFQNNYKQKPPWK